MIEIWILTLVLLDPSAMIVIPVKTKGECEGLAKVIAADKNVAGRSAFTACTATKIFNDNKAKAKNR